MYTLAKPTTTFLDALVTPAELKKLKPAQPARIRAFVRLFDYYNYEFTDSARYLCVKIIAANGVGQPQNITKLYAFHGQPAWSPDGTRMALTLSQDGNPEIYVMNLLDKKLTRLTQDNAIDTEARWSPDGQSLKIGRAHV